MQEAIFTLRIDWQPARPPSHHHLEHISESQSPVEGAATGPLFHARGPPPRPSGDARTAGDETGDATGPNHGQRQGSEAGARGDGQRRGSTQGLMQQGIRGSRLLPRIPAVSHACPAAAPAAAPAATTRDYGRARGTARTVSHVRRRRRTTLPMPPSPTAPQVVRTPVRVGRGTARSPGRRAGPRRASGVLPPPRLAGAWRVVLRAAQHRGRRV